MGVLASHHLLNDAFCVCFDAGLSLDTCCQSYHYVVLLVESVLNKILRLRVVATFPLQIQIYFNIQATIIAR